MDSTQARIHPDNHEIDDMYGIDTPPLLDSKAGL